MRIIIPSYGVDADQFFLSNVLTLVQNGVNSTFVTNKTVVCEKGKYDGCEFLTYPKKLNVFSLSKVCNYGIRKYVGKEDIIIKADVDIIIKNPDIFEFVKKVVDDTMGFVEYCCYTNYEYNTDLVWDENKVQINPGGFIAFTDKVWNKLCGFNENMEGWGWDDFDLLERARKIVNIVESTKYHLFHINHPPRNVPNNNDRNREIAKRGWKNKNWGKCE